MDWQYLLTLALILLAGLWLARGLWRTLRGTKAHCSTGCGRCTIPDDVPAGRIRLPQV